MKMYNDKNQNFEEADLNNFKMFSDDRDRDFDTDHEEDDEDEEQVDENRDWGNVDPAGGDPPTSPGSAV